MRFSCSCARWIEPGAEANQSQALTNDPWETIPPGNSVNREILVGWSPRVVKGLATIAMDHEF
jgi:hypothetical protein